MARGQAILTLRALIIQSGCFDSAWELVSSTYRREVTIPGKVGLLADNGLCDEAVSDLQPSKP